MIGSVVTRNTALVLIALVVAAILPYASAISLGFIYDDNPQIAERIADNAVRTFRDRYLTPAAESCYWRHLVRQYASVLDFEPVLFATGRDGKLTPRGTPFETWLLMN